MKVFGPADERSVQQLQNCIDASEPSAPSVLCADHHPGYSMPIGGVIALKDAVMPAGVGYDIACGNCAVRTDVQAIDVDIARVMDEVAERIAFGMGQKNEDRINDHPVYDSIQQSPVRQQRAMLELARSQLGTVGSGNHYVDLFEDREDGRLWIGVHFGSRGFGHKTACGFLAIAAGRRFDDRLPEGGMDAPPLLLAASAPSGQDYLAAMAIAGEYAYAGRNWVVDRVLSILGAKDTLRVHNHHNFAWRETHNDESYWVIRKGATPAFPGQQGFIGGTMGDDAVIVEGVESVESASALYSTVHGAGRVMSRTQAAGKVRYVTVWRCGMRDCGHEIPIGRERRADDGSNPRCEKCGGKMHRQRSEHRIKEGRVDWPSWQARLKAQRVELRGAGADEAPECYKRLTDVLDHHRGTIRVLHTLRPIGVAMAGSDVVDLYKD